MRGRISSVKALEVNAVIVLENHEMSHSQQGMMTRKRYWFLFFKEDLKVAPSPVTEAYKIYYKIKKKQDQLSATSSPPSNKWVRFHSLSNSSHNFVRIFMLTLSES